MGGDPADDALLVLLRSAVTNELAAARIHVVLAARVAPALAAAGGPDLPAGRTALVSAQLLGLALTRYLLLLPAVAARTPDQIGRSMAPAIAATLNPT